jgi:nucleoside-diphosphate-sugar epimerase
MTVLVTGATGLLGSHLIDLLVERGMGPRALVRPGDRTNGFTRAGVEVHVADVRDSEGLAGAMRGVECVLHCAARTGPWGPQDEYESTNVYGLETLVRAAVSAAVRRVVHVSSITVHGNDVRGVVTDESSPLRTESNPYSRSKVAGEHLLQRMIQDGGAPVTIVRPGWIYGPRDDASFARFATMIRDGRMVMIGSGHNRLPLIYVGDAAKGVMQAAEADGAAGRCYLLVNDEPVTQRDYLCAIATELGVPAPKKRIPYRLGLMVGAGAEVGARLARRQQPPPVMRYGIQLLGGDNRFTIERAKRELGFSPQVNVAEGVRRSVEWYRAAQAGAVSARNG